MGSVREVGTGRGAGGLRVWAGEGGQQAFGEGVLGVWGREGLDEQPGLLSEGSRGALGAAHPSRLSPRSHVHVQAFHPGPGGAAAPRPPGHEETRVWSWALERLRGEGAAGGEHRGGSSQVRPGPARRVPLGEVGIGAQVGPRRH